ncbi:hypothetical protein ACP4OV_011091 [Aristida adscensionis]
MRSWDHGQQQEQLRRGQAGEEAQMDGEVPPDVNSICGPAPAAPPDVVISDCMTDEAIVLFLAERKAEDPLPLNVKEDVDFSTIDPRDCQGNIWFMNWSDAQQPYEHGIRKSKNGYWKMMDSSLIPVSTPFVGVKVILEFYEGRPPTGVRIGWVMHEYHLKLNAEDDSSKGCNSLSRVFFQGEGRIHAEEQRVCLNAGTPNDSFGSHIQYITETREKIVAPNAKAAVTNKLSVHLSKEQDKQLCEKSSWSGRRLRPNKIPQIRCIRQRLSRRLLHDFKLKICERLGEVLDAISHDLAAMKLKINKGPLTQQLVEMASYNESALSCIAKHADDLSKQFSTVQIAASLLVQVKKLQEDNAEGKTFGSILVGLLTKLRSRIQEEEQWSVQFIAYLQSLFGKIRGVASEVEQFKEKVLQLKDQVAGMLCEVSNFALYRLIETLKCMELCLGSARRKFHLICDEINSSEGLLDVKIRYFSRVAGHQKYMQEQNTRINLKLCKIRDDIEEISYMHGVLVEADFEDGHDDLHQYEESFDPEDYAFKSFKEQALDLCFSWRTRLFHNRLILSPVRLQSGATCAYYATLSAVESLYKREYAAYPTILKDSIGQPDEFLINLSRTQLEDIVEGFYARNKTMGSKRLNICLDKMKNEGVGSEESYRDPWFQPRKRYKIKEYEEICLKPEKVKVQKIMDKPVSDRRRRKLIGRRTREVAKDVSEVIKSNIFAGRVLITNFWVTTEFFRVLPHEIYRVPKRNAKYEVTEEGQWISHCVVVVGFGVRKGENYLIYQNSYGKSWGKDGFGRIYLDSIRKLFLARV